MRLRRQVAPRIMWGYMSGAGTVLGGSGDFKVGRSSAGVYIVTYARPFYGGLPAIALATASQLHHGFTTTPTAQGFGAYLAATVNGAGVDSEWSFIVIGRDV